MPDVPAARPRRCVLAAATATLVALPLVASLPASADDGDDRLAGTVEVVSERSPLSGPAAGARTLGASVPAAAVPAGASQPVDAEHANPWEAVATIPGVVKDVDFATRKIGYAAAELGDVWKTVDGGSTWARVVDENFPLYFYGVAALSRDEVVVSGFDNAASTAIVWRTTDGGETWDSSISFTGNWGNRVRFADDDHGLMTGILGSGTWATSTGGQTADEWTAATADPDQGWIGNQFTLLKDRRAYLSGIAYCTSEDGGMAWSCGDSVDEVFDGPVDMTRRGAGWVGGGSISPTVAGWVHRTTDGGETWSGRTLDASWPVRHVQSVGRDQVWAVGGNVYSGAGGMYVSTDGGATWAVDAETGHEMTSCDQRRVRVDGERATRLWCVGFTNAAGWSSKVYRVDVAR